MDRKQIFDQLQEIFRDIFDVPDLILKDSTNSDDIDEWDSLNHINLVVAIEKQFNMKFSFNELATLKDVGAMIDLMEKKINQNE